MTHTQHMQSAKDSLSLSDASLVADAHTYFRRAYRRSWHSTRQWIQGDVVDFVNVLYKVHL